MTPGAGEIWLADTGDEIRREVFVVSDPRFQRLSERVVVAPILSVVPEHRRPWHVTVDGGRVVGVHLLATVATARLLERRVSADVDALLEARRAARFIIG